MTSVVNPYAADPDPSKPEIWEMGYLVGFQDPGASDFEPYNPDLLDIYQQGFDTGKDDNFSSSPQFMSWEEIPAGVEELIEHVIIEGFFELSAHIFKKATLGLVGLFISVVGIPSDHMLQPIPDDFEEDYMGPETDDNISYLAMCPRPDHIGSGLPGVSPEGYWTGNPTNDFGAALSDARDHPHFETLIVRCSTTDNTCGPVWIAKKTP
jgi:hypothetical protein